MNDSITIALKVFIAGRHKPGVEILEDLVGAGLERRLAVQIFLLLPVAYCRVMFEPRGVYFPDYFQLRDDSSSVVGSLPFTSIRFWKDALSAANASTEGGDAFIAVAGRSAEFRAVNQLLIDGAALKDIRCSAGLMKKSDFEEYLSVPNVDRAWWKFWTRSQSA